jgi:hypothetical protein
LLVEAFSSSSRPAAFTKPQCVCWILGLCSLISSLRNLDLLVHGWPVEKVQPAALSKRDKGKCPDAK